MNEISQIAIAEKPGRMQFFDPAPVSESATMLQVIASAASNPAVDVAKMEQLFALQAQIAAREAKVAFAAHLADMQRNLPTIDRNGRIEIKDKDDRVKQSTAFADWADINEAIKPVLADHGFSLSFRTATAPDGKLRVTAILRHKQGHEEETYMDLMHDSTGSKNAVQAVGSSMTYGKRYTACAILNITSRAKDERDTDGKQPDECISQEQIKTIQRLIVETGSDIPKFCAFMEVQKIPEITPKNYAKAITALEAKRSKA